MEMTNGVMSGSKAWQGPARRVGASLTLPICMFLGACQSQDRVGPSTSAATAAPAPAEPVFLNGVEESNFKLTWQPAALGAGAKAGQGELVLVAKAPFKCNQDYPYKLKLTAGSAIPSKTEITKPDIMVAKDRVAVPVSFEVNGPAPAMEGTFAFSVCTDDKCLIERKTLKLTVDAVSSAPSGGVVPSGGVPSGGVPSSAATVGGSATP